jgi:hypothetical protein
MRPPLARFAVPASLTLTLTLLPLTAAAQSLPRQPDRLVLPPAEDAPRDAARQAEALPQVDPVTGRPVPVGPDPVDLLDRTAQARLRKEGAGTVPAYLPLPSGTTQQNEVPTARIADRALGARRLQGDTVRGRARPAYDAPGFRTGGFLIRPYVAAGAAYDANVYAEENPRTDLFGSAIGGFEAASEWGRHRATLSGNVTRREYARFVSENETTYRLIGTGRYDLSSHVALTGEASQQRILLERGAVEEVSSQAFPTVYDLTVGQLGGRVDYGPTQINLTGSIARTRFRDNRALDGAFTDQSFRNFRAYTIQGRVEQDVWGQRAIYVEVEGERRRFETAEAQRLSNADVVTAIVGLRGRVSQLVRGKVGVGLIHVDFQTAGAASLNGLAIDADLEWLVRERTTLSFSANRELRTVAQRGVRSALFTTVDLTADEEVRRNLILSLGLRLQSTDYVEDTRRATAFGVTLGADWLADRHWTIRPRLSYLRRTDRGFGIDLGPEDAQAAVSAVYRF